MSASGATQGGRRLPLRWRRVLDSAATDDVARGRRDCGSYSTQDHRDELSAWQFATAGLRNRELWTCIIFSATRFSRSDCTGGRSLTVSPEASWNQPGLCISSADRAKLLASVQSAPL